MATVNAHVKQIEQFLYRTDVRQNTCVLIKLLLCVNIGICKSIFIKLKVRNSQQGALLK